MDWVKQRAEPVFFSSECCPHKCAKPARCDSAWDHAQVYSQLNIIRVLYNIADVLCGITKITSILTI